MLKSSVSGLDHETHPFAKLLADYPEDTSGAKRHSKMSSAGVGIESGGIFDEKPSSDDSQLTLSIRQPSYSSLHGQFVLKGGEVQNGLEILEEDPHVAFDNIEPGGQITLGNLQSTNQALSDNYASLNTLSYSMPHYHGSRPAATDEDEEEHQEKMILELQEANAERWREMGYNPPHNVIPLFRAASQTHMSKTDNIKPIEVPSIKIEPIRELNTRFTRVRSGSCDEKCGSRTNILCKKNKKHLPGRLDEIVKEPPTSSVWKSLLGEEIPENTNIVQLRASLKRYLDVCCDLMLWEESSIINRTLLKYGLYHNQPQSIKQALKDDYAKYLSEARELDNKYTDPQFLATFFKPSAELQALQSQKISYERNGNRGLVKDIIRRIVIQTDKEIDQTNKKIKEYYRKEDIELKMKHAELRAELRRKNEKDL